MTITISRELLNLIGFLGGALVGGVAVYAVFKPGSNLLRRIIRYSAISIAAIATGAATVSQMVALPSPLTVTIPFPQTISQTPSPTSATAPISMPTSEIPILITGVDNILVRSAPAANAEIISRVSRQTFSLTGISASRVYYRVEFNGQEGWVWRGYGSIVGDLSAVPVVESQ